MLALNRLVRSSSSAWVRQIEGIVGKQGMITDEFELQPYNRDWTTKFQGKSQLAILPRNTQQLSEVMKVLNENNVKVVPQGGNTGLVGGGVPLQDEVIILMKNFNQVERFDETTNILTAQSGCVLSSVNNYLEQFNCQMPWDLGSRGSCQIGGNVSTNAGGINVVRNGMLRGYILGMEVVLPNGQIMDLTNENRKDNTGFDLKQLFIGAEGQLGIITKLNVYTLQIPAERQALFLKLRSYEDVIKVLRLAKREFCQNLNSFEFIEGRALELVTRLNNIPAPFNFREGIRDYYVLMEASGQDRMQEQVENFAGKLFEQDLCIDCVLNKNETEYNQLWKMRDEIGEAMGKLGKVLKYDLSLHPEKFEWFVHQVFPERNSEGKEPYNTFYGHVGDGNVHFNTIYENMDALKSDQARIEAKMFKTLKEIKGSISAEHGIGQIKKQYLPDQKGETTMQMMRDFKKLMDPKNILNPGKMLDI